MSSGGPVAEAARDEVRALAQEKGHAVDVAAHVRDRLEAAFAEGSLSRTPQLEQALADLRLALDQAAGQKLGGKSGEAARFIVRAIVRGLDEA
ncbi:MAG TPA: hypothetical protein VFW92_07950 [Candidatus Limnocylindrales bacterium]|nr:hypothetical protein [Candidatus Limnocylindrales bacterium]